MIEKYQNKIYQIKLYSDDYSKIFICDDKTLILVVFLLFKYKLFYF